MPGRPISRLTAAIHGLRWDGPVTLIQAEGANGDCTSWRFDFNRHWWYMLLLRNMLLLVGSRIMDERALSGVVLLD